MWRDKLLCFGKCVSVGDVRDKTRGRILNPRCCCCSALLIHPLTVLYTTPSVAALTSASLLLFPFYYIFLTGRLIAALGSPFFSYWWWWRWLLLLLTFLSICFSENGRMGTRNNNEGLIINLKRKWFPTAKISRKWLPPFFLMMMNIFIFYSALHHHRITHLN